MLNRLHIPLSRHHKTTHQPRWVVWFLVIFLLMCVLLVTHLTTLWFTRNTIFTAAPEATQYAVQLIVNKKTLPILERILSSTPLISNRGLSLHDILSYTQGEIGWFFHEDGSRSLAIHTQSKQLPKELLDAQHVVVQQVSKSTFLLSEKLQPISGIKAKKGLSKWMPTLKNHLGEFYDQEQRQITNIYSTKEGITMSLPQKYSSKNKIDWQRIPSDVSLVLSTPVSPNILSHIQVGPFDSYVNPLIGHSLSELILSILSQKGILMTKNSSSFVISSEAPVKKEDRVRLLQTALILKNPSIQLKILPDKTSIQELIADPAIVSIEERTINGNVFLKASSGSQTLLLSKEGEFLFSNEENLLRDWLNLDEKEKTTPLCDANIAFIDLEILFRNDPLTKNYYDASVVRLLFSKFHSASLELKGNKTLLNLCF